MTDTDRLPPQALDAEACVLGSMIRDNTCIPTVTALLTADSFYLPDHAAVFAAIVRLADEDTPADTLLIANALTTTNDLERVGGHAFLQSLLDAAPSAAHAEPYAKVVQEKERRRRLVNAGKRMATLAHDQSENMDDITAACEAEFYDAARGAQASADLSVGSVLADVMASILDGKSPELCLPTGYFDLDELLVGLPNGTLTVVGGRPSMGKTSFGRNVLLKAAVPRYRRPVGGPAVPALIFSLEESRQTLVQAMLCCLARVDSRTLRAGRLSIEQVERLKAVVQVLDEAPLWVSDRSSIGVAEIRSQTQRLKLTRPDLGLVVVDYLQLLSTRSGRSREQEVAETMRALKHMARDLDIPVMALSQLSRAAEARADRTPQLSDLRESGSIEQDADNVLLLYREHYYHPDADPMKLDVIVAKQRNGPTGAISLAFTREHTRLDDWMDTPDGV